MSIVQELRSHYEANLFEFAKYINPGYMYGEIHEEVFAWLQKSEEDEYDGEYDYQLLLLPRGHLKSHCLAVYTVWKITRKPWSTFVYLTAGEDLATVQMAAIKGMMETEQYRLLWPEMIKPKESDRDKWSTWAINVDHPERKARRIRDFTLIIKTVGSSSTGLHCSDLILDDVVTKDNAYSEAGRKIVENAVSDFAAIKNTGAKTKCAGTRYDEKDLYGQFEKAEVPQLDPETGEVIGSKRLWKVMCKKVETQGDGLGVYLWPRTKSPTTDEWFGFDLTTLSYKKAEFVSLGRTAQFYAQYYNEPNSTGEQMITGFQYYSRKNLRRSGDKWYYMDNELNISVGMDLAWSDETGTNRADYTAIVVIGVDKEGYIYILDAVRFRTSKYSEYYRQIRKLYDLWRFRKLYVESEGAGKFIIEEMQRYIRADGLSLSVIGKSQSRKLNAKIEAHAAYLEPRYANNSVFHYKGGVIADLEEELKTFRPKFDDLKDALTIAIKYAKSPTRSVVREDIIRSMREQDQKPAKIAGRFGGRR